MSEEKPREGFIETRGEAIALRRKLRDKTHDVYFTKLNTGGYYVFRVSKGLFKKKKKEEGFE